MSTTTMPKSQCQAKNPNTCPYHGTKGQLARAAKTGDFNAYMKVKDEAESQEHRALLMQDPAWQARQDAIYLESPAGAARVEANTMKQLASARGEKPGSGITEHRFKRVLKAAEKAHTSSAVETGLDDRSGLNKYQRAELVARHGTEEQIRKELSTNTALREYETGQVEDDFGYRSLIASRGITPPVLADYVPNGSPRFSQSVLREQKILGGELRPTAAQKRMEASRQSWEPRTDVFGKTETARDVAARTMYDGPNQEYKARRFTTAQAADADIVRGIKSDLAEAYGDPKTAHATYQYTDAEKQAAADQLFASAKPANPLDSKTPVKRRSGIGGWLKGLTGN